MKYDIYIKNGHNISSRTTIDSSFGRDIVKKDLQTYINESWNTSNVRDYEDADYIFAICPTDITNSFVFKPGKPEGVTLV